MAYWWVNQKQTWQYEIKGDFLWSPKCKKNGSRSQFYENMRLVHAGDKIFSYCKGLVQNIGTATNQAESARKPENLGEPGQWDADGWQVPVSWHGVARPLNPRDIIDQLIPHLPKRYSPLQQNGNGLQGVYLAALPKPMAELLLANL